MTSYLTRRAAVAAARKGVAPFMTYFDQHVQAWYIRPVELALPAEALALEALPFVSHVEWALRDSHLMPCIVVTCPLHEANPSIPAAFTIEPLDASTWANPATAYQRPKSQIASPVKVVWAKATEMIGATRAEVIAACVALGVDKSTAATQYYKWGKAQQA